MPKAQKKESGIDKRIEHVFTTPSEPGSFGSLSAVYESVNRDSSKTYIPKARVKKWLDQNRAFTIHRQPKRVFKRRKVVVSGIHYQWQADLVDMSKLSKDNQGNNFILTVIDVFSKYGYAEPVKRKDGISVTNAFRKIASSAVLPKVIQTDKGREFLNVHFREWCKENNIKHFSSEDDSMKAQVVERFNSTLENKLSRMMSHYNTNTWIDKLDSTVDSINHAFNRSIARSPASVNYLNQEEVYRKLYPTPKRLIQPSKKKDTFKVGDYVRLLGQKGAFDKGYHAKWTKEVFLVRDVSNTADGSIRIYKVKDLNNEDIIGTFYHHELQKTVKPTMKIEKIVGTKGENKIVKWLDQPESKNSYVRAQDVKRFM